MDKIKRMCISLVMAVVVLFGGIFSLFGVKNVKVNALVNEAYGRTHLVYYFCDSYPTFPNTLLKTIFTEDLLVYDIQKVDESTFNDMVTTDEYFVGLDMNSMLILDLKTFAPETSVLCELFCQVKSGYGCKTVLVTNNVSSSGVVFSSLAECVDLFYSSTCRLQAFAQEIVATQRLSNIGNGTVNGTTFLIDNIIDNPEDYAGAGLDTLCDADPFLDYFITELLDYADPDPTLTTVSSEDVLTNSGIRIWLQTGGGSFVDAISGQTNISLPDTNGVINVYPTATQDYAVVGFSNIDPQFWGMIDNFHDNVNEIGGIPSHLMPVHILEVVPIEYGEDGISAFIFSGADANAEDFLTVLQNLYFSS
ncbi:MAG: hypothetical protein IJX30_05305 [Clostridia bacterium]|nr:hypothetical protein [Clostridia bacterium]